MQFLFTLWLFLTLTSQLSAQFKIVYLSNESGNFDLYSINPDGTNKAQLTKNVGWDWSPLWNKSLQAIIYNSKDTLNNFKIKAMSLQGEEVPSKSQDYSEFILSPDGSKALYTLKDRENRYIGIIDVDSNKNKLLVIAPAYNGRPSWSPDGTHFSFISDRDGNNELYVYNLNAHKVTRLTDSEKSEKYTSWMPDSKNVVYTYHYSDERGEEHNDIFSVNILTGYREQITDDEKFYQEIAVSPDGKKIAFHAKRKGQDHIYILDILSNKEFQVTKAEAYHGEPIWAIMTKK